jgi:rhodanese-related sulfurtransferase
LPQSIVVEGDDALGLLPHDARDRTIVTFCTCPSEASAAVLAERLIKAGYTRVRVLVGGPAALSVLGA